MRLKYVLFNIVLCLICVFSVGNVMADKATTALPADTAPTSDDLVAVVNSPDVSPADVKVTIGNLTKALSLTNFPATSNVISLLSAADYADFRTLLGVQTIVNPITGTGTQYYLPVWTSASTQSTLASLGTSGYVLTSNGSGAAPTWQATGAGAMIYPGSGVAVSTGGAWGTSLDITAISDSTSTTSSTIAASSTAAKAAWDLANGKQAALTYPVTGVVAPTAGSLVKWGASGNTLVDATGMGTGDFKADGSVLMTGALRPSTAGGQIIGSSSLPVGSVYIGNAATNNVQLTAGTTSGGKIVTLPSQTGILTVAPTTTAAGQVFMGTATAGLGAWSTNIFPSTGTAYRLPVFSATNTMTELATAGTTGQVLMGISGAIPAWTATPNGLISVTASSFTGTLTGNASTATALAADPSDCASGYLATTIAASGNLSCTAYSVASPGASGGILQSDGTNWARVTTITGVTISTADVDGSTSQTLAVGDVTGTTVYNTGMGGADVALTLPTAAAGLNALFTVGTAQAFKWGVRAAATDKIYLIAADGTISAGADNGYARMTNAQVGQSFACWAFKTDAYDWSCKAVAIGTSTFAAN